MPRQTIKNNWTPSDPVGATDLNNIGDNLLYILDENTVFNNTKKFFNPNSGTVSSIIEFGSAANNISGSIEVFTASAGAGVMRIKVDDNSGVNRERITVNFNGNIGIDNASPSYRLDVTTDNSNTARLFNASSGTVSSSLLFGSTSNVVSGKLQFDTAASEAGNFELHLDDIGVGLVERFNILFNGDTNLNPNGGNTFIHGRCSVGSSSIGSYRLESYDSSDKQLYLKNTTSGLVSSRIVFGTNSNEESGYITFDTVAADAGNFRIFLDDVGVGLKERFNISFNGNTTLNPTGGITTIKGALTCESNLAVDGNILPTSTPTEQTISRTHTYPIDPPDTTYTDVLPRGQFKLYIDYNVSASSSDPVKIYIEHLINGGWRAEQLLDIQSVITGSLLVSTGTTIDSSGTDTRVKVTFVQQSDGTVSYRLRKY